MIRVSDLNQRREDFNDWPLGSPFVVALNPRRLHGVLNKQTHQQVSTVQYNRDTVRQAQKSPFKLADQVYIGLVTDCDLLMDIGPSTSVS